MASFSERIIRAAKLDPNLYEEVEADEGAMGQAVAVVVLSAVAAGIAAVGEGGLGGIVMRTLVALVAWCLWAFVTYLIGTKLLPEPQTESNYGELLRTLGFASAPGLIRVIGIVPGLGGIVFSIAGLWMLVAMVIAVRQALDYESTWRAIAVCAIGFIAYSIIMSFVIGLLVKPSV
jgi:hypothetical protein